ncbi:putative cystathionine gamma-synthase protein [Pseudomonas coronafaciens pv. atropurpurea]|uniref:hypothetical protein n=1 Tax=Pseudomonas coronafaciens TaxID=53409 RepID=UPI0006E5A4BE|nr:hypothetical protein [Pseudomonas coronafaciens]KPW41582.1 putative cystathionine gamma-synthase protein [Pseudomonas coronafaciens pv. atropurpurea]RMT60519.1 putative cystathionine gamma-synthase protein [Pseudomonas coronafaciens pv. atropurpurea]
MIESFMGDALDSTRKMISSCRSPGLDGRRVAQRYRLLIQQFGLARSALNWCSASTDQSTEIMFFDPADLQTSSVNYERYGSVALRELELNLVRAIGFGGGARTALLTSSGQRPTRRWKAFFYAKSLQNIRKQPAWQGSPIRATGASAIGNMVEVSLPSLSVSRA